MNVTSLEYRFVPDSPTPTEFAYGDAFKVLLTAATPPGYRVLNGYALAVSDDWDEAVPIKRPLTFHCRDICMMCNKQVCTPDLGRAEPPTTGDTTSAVRFAINEALDIPAVPESDPLTLRLGDAPGTPGPIYVGPAADDIELVLQRVSAWLGPQPEIVELHVFRLEDPAGTHPLHNKIIAIPVPHVVRPRPPLPTP